MEKVFGTRVDRFDVMLWKYFIFIFQKIGKNKGKIWKKVLKYIFCHGNDLWNTESGGNNAFYARNRNEHG